MRGAVAAIACVLLLALTPCTQAEDAVAADVMARVLEVNAVWLEPQPTRVSYVVTSSGPEDETPESGFVSRVWIDGDDARWEMDAELHTPSGTRRDMAYTLVVHADEERYLRGPERLMAVGRQEARDVRRLWQGTVWTTAMHAIQQNGLPDDARIVERNRTESGEIVILETDLGDQRLQVGLGSYHLFFGQASTRIGSVRLHIKLPEYIPVLEEILDHDVRIQYGPDQLVFGEQRAPETIEYIGELRDGQSWVLEARFRKIEELWLLERALNNHDGSTVKEIVVTDVSTDPIDQELFLFPADR